MSERFTKEQKDLCRKIDRLRRELGERWRPRAGDWLLYHNRIYLCYGFYKENAGWRICFRRPDDFSNIHDYSYPNKEREFIPILSWQDCRAWLRKMGWFLLGASETIGADLGPQVVLVFTTTAMWDMKQRIERFAPTDLEAIMLVVIEVLKRLVRQSEGGGGKVKEVKDELDER